MSWFVVRNAQGKVTTMYRKKRPGIAEEELADAHPEVAEYLEPTEEAIEFKREKDLLKSTSLLWIIETLVGELESMRRGAPATARMDNLRTRLSNL